ncbi:MAG: cytochrome c [Pseudomonadota bacterium]
MIKLFSIGGLAAILVTAGLAFTDPPRAESDPDIKERMALMKDMGQAMRTLAPIFKGTVAYDAEAVRSAAETIRARSGKEMTRLFPEGSLSAQSEALPAIWTDWERFAMLADELGFYATGLSAAAGNPRTDSGSQGGGTLGGQAATLGEQAGEAAPKDPEALGKLSPDVAFSAMAQTCGTCHTSFRKDD